MPYFFILPAFVLYVVAFGVAILLASLYKPAAPLRPYLTAMLGWSCVGFVAATLVYAALFMASAFVLRRFVSARAPTTAGVMMGLLVFVAPFVASLVGVVGGAVFGIKRIARGASGIIRIR